MMPAREVQMNTRRWLGAAWGALLRDP